MDVPDAPAEIDAVFHALANPTRRSVVERLASGPCTVSELAEPFSIALPTVLQHLRVLESGGIVATSKRGRVRTVRIVPDRLRAASGWLEQQRLVWEQRLDRLDAYATTMEDE